MLFCFHFLQLLHKVIDVCCDTVNVGDALSAEQAHLWSDLTFTPKFVPSVWPSEGAFRTVVGQLINLCTQIACEVIEPEALITKQGFSEKTQLILQECTQLRQKELFKGLVFKTVTSQYAHLHNYDWQVSVVMSSDRMASIKVPIIKLTLALRPPTGHLGLPIEEPQDSNHSELSNKVLFEQSSSTTNWKTNTRMLSYEMTAPELASFIQTLEDAKEALAQAVTV